MIPHSRPTIEADDIAAVAKAVSSGQLSQGAQVAAFEKVFATATNVKESLAVSSGTAALHLALLALGVGRGHEVILPTHVCPALLNAVNYTGARPKLVDVRYEDANISAADVRGKLTGKTRAIIVPHMFGTPADLKPLLKLGVPVIEDCAQAAGAKYYDCPVGSLGAVSIFSFYATKMLTTGEGGMVLSNDRKLMNRCRDLAAYDHRPDYHVRYNYKITEFQAALGLVQFRKLAKMLNARKKLAACYALALKDAGVETPHPEVFFEPAWYRYVIKSRCPAEKVIAALQKHGICAEQPLFRPLHVYLGLRRFPNSDRLMKQSISLPLYPTLTAPDVYRIARQVVQEVSTI